MICRLHKHEVQTAHSGAAAIECGDRFKPTLVLLDLSMPGMDGYETCITMRKCDWASEAVFVALTGWGQSDDRLRSEQAGFNFHVVKPIEKETLKKLLSSNPSGASN